MRRLTDHRLDTGGFDDSVRALVRGAPWWALSLAVHLIAALILWQVPWQERRAETAPRLTADLEDPPPELDEPDDLPPPEIPPEDIVEKETEFVDETPVNEDTDEIVPAPEGEVGDASGPLDGDFFNTAIGPRGGSAGGRGPGGSGRGKGVRGSRGATDDAVELGLRWLAAHQDLRTDGRWDCDDYMKHDPADDRCDGPGGPLYDVGVTGLALLAFLGAGYTDRGTDLQNPYRENVQMGLRFLIAVQDEDGCLGDRTSNHFMYNHALGTLALAEAYWMTKNPRYKTPAQDAVDFICRARNPYLAWRYEPQGGENDTSVTAWMVMALKSAKFAGLRIDPDAFEGARLWIDRMTDPEFGQVGYTMPGGAVGRPEGLQDRFPPEKSQSMTAAGILTRIFLGEDPRTSAVIKKGADLCLELPPEWNPDDGSIDMYYWYYGTLAMFQVGGTHWKKWNVAMKRAILESQHGKRSGARAGSWDPIGPWGADGGRVYATATLVMCLEVYYRYDRVVGIGR